MTLDEVTDAYARAMATTVGPGELVTLVRSGNVGVFQAHGWVTEEFVPQVLAGGMQQGRRVAYVLAADVVASGFPLPFLPKQDRLKWGTKTNVIVKDASRRFQGVLIAYQFDLDGA